jgi:hypothetical protein
MIGLEAFQAFETGLSGELPSELGLMTSLQKFDVESCSLGGKIPITIGGIDSLEELLLSKILFWEGRSISDTPVGVASSSIYVSFLCM